MIEMLAGSINWWAYLSQKSWNVQCTDSKERTRADSGYNGSYHEISDFSLLDVLRASSCPSWAKGIISNKPKCPKFSMKKG